MRLRGVGVVGLDPGFPGGGCYVRQGGGMVYIGIDPGATGSVCVIADDGLAHVYPTPYENKEFQIVEMAKIIRGAFDSSARGYAVIESAQPMPKQGVCSMFHYGKGFGIWLAILAISGVPHSLVHARTWTRVMLEGAPGVGKERAYSVARKLVPTWEPRLKKEQQYADSILLALYARRRCEGGAA